jgi:signal transduction histidine kinase
MAISTDTRQPLEAVIEQAVAWRTAELERANEDLEAFARQLAHELRTPIGQVAGIAQLLLQRLADSGMNGPAGLGTPSPAPAGLNESEGRPIGSWCDARRWLELQLKAAEQMGDTVQTLLDLARSTQAPLPFAAIDLSELCHALIEQLPPLPRRAPVLWHIAPGMLVHGVPSMVTLLMRNLLSNAAKYTCEVSDPTVSVGARAEGAQGTRVSVVDNGAGFDQAAATGMFQPFVRLHAADRFAGTGLGLSIARRVVERHRGWIRAHGVVGRGACFEFMLAPLGGVTTAASTGA